MDLAFAEIFGAESAIVRAQVSHFFGSRAFFFLTVKCSLLLIFILPPQFFSGTHAITCALFAFLRPGDEVRVSFY